MGREQQDLIAQAHRLVDESGSQQVMLALVDLDGVLRGKYLSRDKFLSCLEGGTAICAVVFGWDSRDTLYDNPYTGWFNGFPDDALRIVPETGRLLPFDGTPFFLTEFTGAGAALCPRNLAGRVLARAAAAGYTVRAGFEYELYAFRETDESARAKGYRGLAPLTATTGGYSVLRSAVHAEFLTGMLDLGRALNAPIEGLHPEAGEGALEFALAPADGMEPADRAVVIKTIGKAWAQRQGVMLCYMAKPTMTLPGCGGHLHLSLWDDRGQPVFHDAAAEGGLSQVGRHFVAGQERHMAELLALSAPTVNAMTRLTPGYWAPTAANWGFDNRTASIRVVGNTPKSLRVEYRIPGADANPYLVFAAALASGLAGIAGRLEPAPALRGNAYAAEPPAGQRLPRSLHAAADRLRGSTLARDWFGDRFVEHFALSREVEEDAFRRHVTDWELHRYFEMI